MILTTTDAFQVENINLYDVLTPERPKGTNWASRFFEQF